jgi:radical SAM superfamily enzyme YgiQ (UPF0313 family)
MVAQSGNAKTIHSPVRGLDGSRAVDAIFVNTPLRDYEARPRCNDFTLPVLGLGYIATVSTHCGLNVGLLDGEALGLSFAEIASEINHKRPRWVGFNLLAPTYMNTSRILSLLDPSIRVMLGGHHAKAMPEFILKDSRLPRLDALIVGEAEYRVAALLEEAVSISRLPRVFWRANGSYYSSSDDVRDTKYLAPDVNAMPFVDRNFFVNDPYVDNEMVESAIVGSRGCPFDCSFCGAARSANPDVTIRIRTPRNILQELFALKARYEIGAARFVDDLFLANVKAMTACASAFISENLSIAWDATGRINVLCDVSSETLTLLRRSGCREVALGIESASDRLLRYIDKKITSSQAQRAVIRLCERGINVKGYFILGLPTETRDEHYETLSFIKRLWEATDALPGRFRCSVFEYRPYPGTPDWNRLLMRGYKVSDLLTYDAVDITGAGSDRFLLDRDEFNFATGLQFSAVPLEELRNNLSCVMRLQKERLTPDESLISGA